MAAIKKSLVALLRDEEGATMVEYGLMLALIAAVCIFAVRTIGTSAKATFEDVDGGLQGAAGGGAGG